MQPLESELKSLIVSALLLDHVRAEDIDSEAPLFGAGLGLDSIDALELAMAIERQFGVKIRADDPNTRALFASVRALASPIAAHRSFALVLIPNLRRPPNERCQPCVSPQHDTNQLKTTDLLASELRHSRK